MGLKFKLFISPPFTANRSLVNSPEKTLNLPLFLARVSRVTNSLKVSTLHLHTITDIVPDTFWPD